MKKTAPPAVLIAAFTITSFGLIAIAHLIANKPLIFLDYKNAFGLDYMDFFQASQNILAGQSPYSVPFHRYVTTPIPALFNVLLVPLGFDHARVLMYFLIPATLAAGYQLVASSTWISAPQRTPIQLAGMSCLLFGYPFYFLLQRENIDGWVVLFLCIGLYCMQKPQQEFFSGLAFSLAITFKIYPLLILLPLILQKRWRTLLWLVIWLGVWTGISWFWLRDLQEALAFRTISLFRLDENASLVALISYTMILLHATHLPSSLSSMGFWPYIAYFIFGVFLVTSIIADFKRGGSEMEGIPETALYFPFMVALPNVVYHYSLIICVILIPVLCRLWEICESRQQRLLILMISLGVALTQWQAVAIYFLTGNPLSHAIPGAGLLITMAGISMYKMDAHLQMGRSATGGHPLLLDRI